MARIHPRALVEAGAELDEGVQVEPFAWVEAGARIGAGCRIAAQARIHGCVHLGPDNRVGQGAVLGGLPQDLGFDPALETWVEIGPGNVFHEYVTVHRATRAGGVTRIGDGNYFMAYSHVAHDCRVGDRNIFANGATLGGFVEIADAVNLSGQVAVHQFCRVGRLAMVSGLVGVAQDVPPFALVAGHRGRVAGLNTVGLRRAGIGPAGRQALKRAYRDWFHSGLPRTEALARLAANPEPLVRELVEFVAASERGVMGYTTGSR